MASNSEATQKSFNPSWMQASSTRMPKSNGTHRTSKNDEEDPASLEVMDPILSQHRYGREEILALIRKDTKPPDGIERCPFFVEKPQMPIVLTNLNETEQRLQQNINSSKALSAAHRGEWHSSKEGNDSPNSPRSTPWTIAGGSRSGSSFRAGNNRWTAKPPPIEPPNAKPPPIEAPNAKPPPIEPPNAKPDQWFYLDPQGVQRGPFETSQMHAWFLNGYFQPDLKIMQPGDTIYTPLGDLIKNNGALTPFNVKKRQVHHSPIGSNSAVSSNTSNSNPWASAAAPQHHAQQLSQEPSMHNFTNSSANELSLESLKILEVKQRLIVEEERKLREKQEAMEREERERKERERQMQEMQAELERKRLEFEQRAREQEKELELKRLQIIEYERQQRERLEQLEAQKEQEHQRILLEAEMVKRREEEVRLKHEAEIKRHREEQRLREQAEEHRRYQEEAEKQRRLQDDAEMQRRLREEADLKRQQQLARHLQEQQQNQAMLAATQQKTAAAPKAAPWMSASGKPASMTTEFREILEQERIDLLRRQQMEEEKRRQDEAAQKKAAAAQGNGNPWNVIKTTTKPAPIPPAKSAPAQPSKAQAKQSSTSKAAKQPKQQAANDAKTEDPLTAWVVQRTKQLHPGIDSDVFATFLQGIESPNEVEDFIITYFGETKRAKEFHQEFLAKRIELRPRTRTNTKDDLSGPASAITELGAIPGGKKAKKMKKVDVSTVLGFRPGADPNRLNVGEIDNTPPAPIKKGKKK